MPLDCIRHLSAFLGCRRAGAVKDPKALLYFRSLALFCCDASGLCFDEQDNVLVTMLSQNEVYLHDGRTGKHLKSIGSDLHAYPISCVTDKNGNLYVSEHYGGGVRLFNKEGLFIHRFKVSFPYQIALSPDENVLFVACRTLLAFSTSSPYLLRESAADGNVQNYVSLAVLSSGQLVVGSDFSGTLDIYNANLTFVRTLLTGGACMNPRSIAVDAADNIYVANMAKHCVDIFSVDGKRIYKLGEFGKAFGWFENPKGVAISSTGVVAVSDQKDVQLFRCCDLSSSSSSSSSSK